MDEKTQEYADRLLVVLTRIADALDTLARHFVGRV